MESLCRKTIQVNLVRIPPQLKELTSKIPEYSPFTERHGCLLNLVNNNTEEDMVKVLFQFFDSLHHCFTFPDYQLVPTLEEFSQLLDIPILEQVPFTGIEEVSKPEVIATSLHLKRADMVSNWETRSGVKGFLAKFMIDKAQLFWDDRDFQAFEDVLDLLFYGLVLFPNPGSFVDVSAIKIFLSRNSVPTLLGDILHALHTRTMKRRGILMCCNKDIYVSESCTHSLG